jgi:aerobic-type carbon monoxide dehydrogenase small subunit (CoxS/CutS family)
VFGGHWIDPKLYICGECKTGGITQQLDLLEQPPPPQEHEPPYDPHTSLIPY